MSPRAACRLEALGFERVYDYVLGIADWKAAGLPTHGTAPAAQRAVDATRTDAPTCTPGETIGDARRRTFKASWEECIVVDCDHLVIGRLRHGAWDAEDAALVAEVMELGPTTVRPDTLLQPLLERMRERGTTLVTVSNPQGRLIGTVARSDAERLLTGPTPHEEWRECDSCRGQWTLIPEDGSPRPARNLDGR